MSYGIIPIAVDLDMVQSFFGSKNQKLIDAIIAEFADHAGRINEMAADYVDEDEPEDKPFTIAQALAKMSRGEELTGTAFVYGYALEMVCRHFGDHLENSEWSSMRMDWFESVDGALQNAGVTEAVFSTTNLVFRGPPIEIPLIDDFPAIGFLCRQEIAVARVALDDKNIAAIKDPAVCDALLQIRKWLETCKAANRDLICFYY